MVPSNKTQDDSKSNYKNITNVDYLKYVTVIIMLPFTSLGLFLALTTFLRKSKTYYNHSIIFGLSIIFSTIFLHKVYLYLQFTFSLICQNAYKFLRFYFFQFRCAQKMFSGDVRELPESFFKNRMSNQPTNVELKVLV